MIVRLVIDVLDGVVVRGVAGNRAAYEPVVSVLTQSTAPRDVAAAFRDELGITTIYVADLDGIVHGRPDLDLLRTLVDDGFDVLADVGIRTPDDALAVRDTGVSGVVCALETLAGPDDLCRIATVVDPARLVFSLDLKSGVPQRGGPDWPEAPLAIVDQVVDTGLSRMIVLDLADVGTNGGASTLDLCRTIRAAHLHVELVTGGGVRSTDDLRFIAESGAAEVLVASAVHNGRLGRTELRISQAATMPGEPTQNSS